MDLHLSFYDIDFYWKFLLLNYIMILVFLIILSYLIAKTLVIKLENENDFLKRELVYIKTEHKKEIEKYQDRLYMMNDAFDQFKKGSK